VGLRTIPTVLEEQKLACTCGAGMPCKCNDLEEPDISAVIEEDEGTRH
jgi:hypothetical protein